MGVTENTLMCIRMLRRSDYVINMVMELFAHSKETAFLMAKEVDDTGRVIALGTHKEKAELKRDQILAFGKDVYWPAAADRCQR
jgi:hypothetical protein